MIKKVLTAGLLAVLASQAFAGTALVHSEFYRASFDSATGHEDGIHSVEWLTCHQLEAGDEEAIDWIEDNFDIEITFAEGYSDMHGDPYGYYAGWMTDTSTPQTESGAIKFKCHS